MSKQLLIENFEKIDVKKYSWSLYFFGIDNRNENPFKVHKVKFKKDDYLTNYAKSSIECILQYQIQPILKVEAYNGENPKVTCDKLLLDSDLIKDKWSLLVAAVSQARTKEIDGKIIGYILEGNKIESTDDTETESITLLKSANPIANLNTKKSVIFKSIENELDILSDETYRLYLTTDFFIMNNCLYTFNLTFEKIFNLEKTMGKHKAKAISTIQTVGGFEEDDEFIQYLSKYSSPRTFLSLNNERVEKLKTAEGKKYIAKTLNIKLDANDDFKSIDKASVEKIIRYLCNKILKDDESKDLFEVSNAKKI